MDNRLRKIATTTITLTPSQKAVFKRLGRAAAEYSDDVYRIVMRKGVNKKKMKGHEKRASIQEEIERIHNMLPDNPSPSARLTRKVMTDARKMVEEHDDHKKRNERLKKIEKEAGFKQLHRMLQAELDQGIASGKMPGTEIVRKQEMVRALSPENVARISTSTPDMPGARNKGDVIRRALPEKQYSTTSKFVNLVNIENDPRYDKVKKYDKQYADGKITQRVDNYVRRNKETVSRGEGAVELGEAMPVVDRKMQFDAYNKLDSISLKPSTGIDFDKLNAAPNPAIKQNMANAIREDNITRLRSGQHAPKAAPAPVQQPVVAKSTSKLRELGNKAKGLFAKPQILATK